MTKCGCYLTESTGLITFCPLHAAAPDLLAALETVWPLLARLPVGIGEHEPKINQARAAIRKARIA